MPCISWHARAYMRQRRLFWNGTFPVHLLDALDKFLTLREECVTSGEIFNCKVLAVDVLVFALQEFWATTFWCKTINNQFRIRSFRMHTSTTSGNGAYQVIIVVIVLNRVGETGERFTTLVQFQRRAHTVISCTWCRS